MNHVDLACCGKYLENKPEIAGATAFPGEFRPRCWYNSLCTSDAATRLIAGSEVIYQQEE
jgi:hypothetical protein